jgi:hypothetical protein
MADQNLQYTERELSGTMKGFISTIVLFSGVAAGIMASTLWPPSVTLGQKLPPLMVTKEVFVEYVNDRLTRLLGRETVTEREAKELAFIRDNIDNLQTLASFYGMKLKEKIPAIVTVQSESPVQPEQEESVRETSQSSLFISDQFEVREAEGVIEAPQTEKSDSEEKSIELEPGAEVAKARRVEKAEEREDPMDRDTPHESSGPSDPPNQHISVVPRPIDPNSALEADDQISEPNPPSLVAMEGEVRQFFANYAERYVAKDLDGLLELFSSRAVENQQDGLDEIRKKYSGFFDKSQELTYHLEDMKVEIYRNAVEARARYEVDQILKKEGRRKIWRGEIHWILVRENGALRIRYLNY